MRADLVPIGAACVAGMGHVGSAALVCGRQASTAAAPPMPSELQASLLPHRLGDVSSGSEVHSDAPAAAASAGAASSAALPPSCCVYQDQAHDVFAFGVMMSEVLTDSVPASDAGAASYALVEAIMWACWGPDPAARLSAHAVRMRLSDVAAMMPVTHGNRLLWAPRVRAMATEQLVALRAAAGEGDGEGEAGGSLAAAVESVLARHAVHWHDSAWRHAPRTA